MENAVRFTVERRRTAIACICQWSEGSEEIQGAGNRHPAKVQDMSRITNVLIFPLDANLFCCKGAGNFE